MEEFHVVVLGAGGVGKSALTLRFMRGEFVDIYDPTIEESFKRNVSLDGHLISLEVLDTAGAEQFTAVGEFYLKNSDGFILVCSLTQAQSVHALEPLLQQIIKAKGYEMDNIPMIIVGTKSDLTEKREVKLPLIKRMKETWKVPYYETSAKKDVGVDEAFHALVRLMITQRGLERPSRPSSHRHRHSESSIHNGKTKKKSCIIM